MRVFISWSGNTSRTAAHALKDWLPLVIQATQPFVSYQDITAGDRWPCALARELEETRFGIICVTPFNLKAPWLHFESGALSKAIDQSCVVPLLFGVDPLMVRGPLSQFQSTRFDEEGMWALLRSLNARLPAESQLSEDLLRGAFEICWPKLNEELRDVDRTLDDETETGYPWFFTAKDLEKREFDPRAKSVWVITPWPYQDIQLACLVGTLRKNIANQVKYTFIIPRDSDGQARQVIHDMFAGKVAVHEVEAEKFESLAVTHYVVLNPEYDEACCPRVFLELPTTERGYWIETSPEAAIKLTHRFRLMIKSEQFLAETMTAGDAPRAGSLPS